MYLNTMLFVFIARQTHNSIFINTDIYLSRVETREASFTGSGYDNLLACFIVQNLNFMREHIRINHTHRDRKPYQCGYCDFRAHTSGNCRKHCVSRHKGTLIKLYPLGDKNVHQFMKTRRIYDYQQPQLQSIGPFCYV